MCMVIFMADFPVGFNIEFNSALISSFHCGGNIYTDIFSMYSTMNKYFIVSFKQYLIEVVHVQG